ncbi:Cof-type HAD-IIB family hydrolase [Chengkuizengella axinellae]|uniref:Cof-type HAD-IIB family hydrolase n=1 Tax=Chengkuizengella axinellae TaxID=3064388 RepID=A0ABT9J135_9BACL|nr:Cof-type HAD-IIB family hydrolase [Chengkuizengella sp. 2205SS18-9]MDP5275334.1 Cof-type HAD-IIB family hydrolase [Chengkuizengella sp. 2205SS18-9]
MKYKMVAIDVDDTLINDDRIVTEATKEALFKAVEQDVVITLATGRMFASAKQIATQINLNVPIITYQGSLVKNLLDEEIIYERSVPQSVSEYIIKYAEKNKHHLQVYHGDELYVKEDNDLVKEYAMVSKVPYKVETDFPSLASKPLTKLLIINHPEIIDQIAEELQKEIGDQVHVTKSKPYFLEIVHKEATKGHALQFLAKHYGCDISEVIAIGDSWNDHEMLEVAGLGVAMGNAIPTLKEIANFVTLSNNEDGVKHVIDKFILNEAKV